MTKSIERKPYAKPTLAKREKLSAVTAEPTGSNTNQFG